MFFLKRNMDKESWIYRSGDLWLPKRTVRSLDTYVIGDEKSLFYINYWHGMHFLSGVLFGVLHLFFLRVQHPFYVYIFLHTLWEAWQLWIGMTKPNIRGVIDITTDTCVGLFGLFLIYTISSPNGFSEWLGVK